MINQHPDAFTKFDNCWTVLRLMVLAATVSWANGVHAQSDQAQAEIGAALTGFRDAINAHTAAGDLDYTHLLPYFDATFKHDGEDAIARTAELAEGLRGGSLSAVAVLSIVSLTTDANGNSKASTTGTLSATTLEGAFTQPWSPTASDAADFAWYYKPAGGTWKLYGNQEPGQFRVKTFIENRQSDPACPSCNGAFNFVWFDAEVPPAQTSSITVTGPGFSATPLVIGETTSRQRQASPAPAPAMSFSSQRFQLYGPAVSSLPPPGSVYTFTITPTSGQPFQVTRTVPQTTSQTMAITNPTGHSLADAHLGGSLTINWTLPSFPVQSIDTYLTTNSAAGMCNVSSNSMLAANATSFTFSPVPTQCLGQPIADNVSQGYPVSVVVEVTGTNGEDTRAFYSFGTSSCSGTNTPPGSLSTASVAANLVKLQWVRACMPTTISNYEVWRSTSAGGPFAKVGFTDQNTRSFSDSTAASGATYYYYVVANDSAGNHSAESNHVTVPTPAGGATGGGGTFNLAIGWNLVGNGLSAALNVATAYGDPNKVNTVWKWVAATSKWAFYSPQAGDGGQAYAAGKGYDFLTAINGGEGYWVNASTAFSAALPVTGSVLGSASFKTTASGWSLLAIGDDKTPADFNRAIDNSATPPSVGAFPLNLISLWAWDNTLGNWYFYAPSLDANGTLASYVASKQYLGFGTRTLGPTTGFWVNRP